MQGRKDFKQYAYFKAQENQRFSARVPQTFINAVSCKLIYRIFAVIKRDESFVNLTRYDLHTF